MLLAISCILCRLIYYGLLFCTGGTAIRKLGTAVKCRTQSAWIFVSPAAFKEETSLPVTKHRNFGIRMTRQSHKEAFQCLFEWKCTFRNISFANLFICLSFLFCFVFSTCLNCYEAPMRRQRRGERSEGLQQDPTARRSLWGVQGGDAKELEAKIRASRRISRWCWTSSSSLRLCKTWSRRLGVMRVVEKEIRHDRWGTWWPIQGRRNVSSCHYGYNNELTAWI